MPSRRKREEYPLVDCNDYHVRFISLSEGKRLAAEGHAREMKTLIHGKPRETWGFKLKEPRNYRPSPTVITVGTMRANAGEFGDSRTILLDEKRKRLRVERLIQQNELESCSRKPAMEDRVELAKAQVAFWPVRPDVRTTTIVPKVDFEALGPFWENLSEAEQQAVRESRA